jgi:hypothetical protein
VLVIFLVALGLVAAFLVAVIPESSTSSRS